MRICTGELRKDLTNDLFEEVENIINQKADKLDEYYILIHADWMQQDRSVLKTTLMIMREIPPALIGTACVHVNNRQGKAEFMGVLPKDIPTDGIEFSEEHRAVAESARRYGSPIDN